MARDDCNRVDSRAAPREIFAPAPGRRDNRGVIETLESRRLLTVTFDVNFTGDGTYAAYYDRIESHLLGAAHEWAKRFVSNASLEIDVIFSPNITRAGGRSAMFVFFRNEGGINIAEDGAVHEMRTGTDPNGATADIEIFWEPNYLINELWFDPDPTTRTAPVPSNRTDAFTVCLHELGHAFGFNGYKDGQGNLTGNWMSRWDGYVAPANDNLWFTGPAAKAVYGGDVPVTWGNRAHIANSAPRPGADLVPDLMNGVVFYRGLRYPISELDYAILKDVGVPVAPKNVTVTGRHVFYNNSAFDGRNPAANVRDLDAIATDKQALIPGDRAGFKNITSYSRGINGVLVEFAGTPQTLTAADFQFRSGRGGNPAQWGAAPNPMTVAMLAGEAGSDATRCLITWANGATKNQWLQVTVRANARTGLNAPDVFYFGNLVGETGDDATGAGATVSSMDVLGARRAAGASAAIDNPFDFDRTGTVTDIDMVLCRNSIGHNLTGFAAPGTTAAHSGDAADQLRFGSVPAAPLSAPDDPAGSRASGRYLLALLH